MVIDIDLENKKQVIAFELLNDKVTSEILYGGGAGGGKSWLGCAWIIMSAIKYPGTRWLIGRSVLKSLKETTLVTLMDTLSSWGIQAGVHFNYNTKDNYLLFKKEYGGSMVLFKDLFKYPSDENFDSLGSLEITGAFIDEGNQISIKAKNIVNSRIRYKLDQYDLTPKLLITCNPAKNWVYDEFYRPYKNNNLLPYRRFIPAYAKDNPYCPAVYIENLKKLDHISKARLLDGLWEYDDDDAILMEYESILNMFSNDLPDGDTYISCDYARFGKDKTVILVWSGWKVIACKVMARSDLQDAVGAIRKYMVDYGVPSNRVVVDEQGTGSGIVDVLGCRGFVASAQPVFVRGMKEVYQNLKAQCYFRFAEKVNKGEVYFYTEDITIRETIVEELEQIRRKDIDKDGKLNIEGKDMIREAIGRSPDFADALSMRVLLDLKTGKRFLI